MDTILFVLGLTVLPIVINKTTERGRLEWIHPHLRWIWVCFLILFSYYILDKPYMTAFVKNAHARFSAHPTLSYIVCGLIGFILMCFYWWITGLLLRETATSPPPTLETPRIQPPPNTTVRVPREPPAPPPSPIIKTDTFSTLVPINVKAPNVPIPLDENVDDPRHEFYGDLVGLAGRPENAEAAGWHIPGPRRLDTENDRFMFVTRLIQFYVFRSIFYLHRGSQGVRITAGEGVRPVSRKAIIAPNAVPQDGNTILKSLQSNEFLHPGDEMVMKARPFSLPAGTAISLLEDGADPRAGRLFACVVRLERPNFYKIDFVVQPSFGTGLGNLPAKFRSQTVADIQTYTVTITMNAEVQRKQAGDFDADGYAAWAQSLLDAMHKEMGFD